MRDAAGQTLTTIDVPHERAVAVSSTVDAYDIGARLPAAPAKYVAVIETPTAAASRDVPCRSPSVEALARLSVASIRSAAPGAR